MDEFPKNRPSYLNFDEIIRQAKTEANEHAKKNGIAIGSQVGFLDTSDPLPYILESVDKDGMTTIYTKYTKENSNPPEKVEIRKQVSLANLIELSVVKQLAIKKMQFAKNFSPN